MSRVALLPVSQPGSIERAVALLRAGEVVALPTDTVYGLGTHGFLAAAIEKLYAIKGREETKAIPLLIARQLVAELEAFEPAPRGGDEGGAAFAQ